jgi:alkanesulfonate monooxygenase SsuD/methylene tetrahydromethanopterin reductase-like flavin-dependent oxidoreductase (luciferase family)
MRSITRSAHCCGVTSVGLIIPQRAATFGVGSVRQLLEMAPIAEQSGLFDTVWIGDSLTSKARNDALACLGALAGMTSRLKLAVGCMASFPVRDPALFAYQWASLDEISEGRMLLAVCNGLQKKDGASELEGQHFGGVRDKERAPRLEEFIGLLRQLWTGEPIDFDGQFVKYQGIQILPKPTQLPCPIWISANPPPGPNATKVLRRVATMSDGLLSVRAAPGYIASNVAMLNDELRAAGRDQESFPVAAYHSINIGPDQEACLDEARRFFDCYYGEGVFGREGAAAMAAVGTVEQCVEQLRAVEAEGATHIALRIASWNQRDQLDRLIKEVIPAFLAG